MTPEDHRSMARCITADVPSTVCFTYQDKERELEVYYFDASDEIKGLLPGTEDWRRFKCDQITNVRIGKKFKPRKALTIL